MNVTEDIVGLPARLAEQLKMPLPGRAAQRTMEPELAFGRHFGPPLPDTRPAAVVALLNRRGGQWQVPLMLRPDSLAYHAGQISFPGGTIEPGETHEQAALREMEEELGISRHHAELLGALTPLFVFNSNFQISPWVGIVQSEVQFQPCTAEVEIILDVPLLHFLDPANRGEHIEQRGSVRIRAPHFSWQGHYIWGATAMILAELLAIVAGLVRSEPQMTATV